MGLQINNFIDSLIKEAYNTLITCSEIKCIKCDQEHNGDGSYINTCENEITDLSDTKPSAQTQSLQ